jgi:uncharacterized membrane protein YcaP (DUF421 family)
MIYDSIKQILGLGLEAKDITFLQMAVRGIVVFIVALATVRVANKRFLSKMTAFDAILAFVMASMLSRAINGSAPFFPTLGTGFILVGVHALLAQLSFRSEWFGTWVKGNAETIVTEGRLDRKTMARAKISEKDLLEEARLNGQVMNVENIQLATLERNGEVSIVPKERQEG